MELPQKATSVLEGSKLTTIRKMRYAPPAAAQLAFATLVNYIEQGKLPVVLRLPNVTIQPI